MKVAGYNLGCKVNKAELEAILSDFEKENFEIVPFDSFADVYIVSTCAVTALAEKKSRKYINRTKRLNPNAITVALGCYIQKEFNDKKDLLDEKLLANIDIFLGTKEKSKVKEYVLAMFNDKKVNNDKEVHIDDVTKYRDYENQEVSKSYDMTRAYVKIQDGCNNFCSYCIIPYVRGRERSRNLNDIMNEIRALEKEDIKEVVLAGIEVAAYGKDLGDIRLIDVIEEVANNSKIQRIRLSSLEQGIITREFLERLKRVDKFCDHFHLSLQSGSDSVLKRMNRKYISNEYYEKVKLIREYFKDAAITTDIIVGFPEETDAEFNDCASFARKVLFSDIHVFPYSIRTGTVAAKMNQVDDKIKEKREKELQKIKYELISKFENENLDKIREVLFEQIVTIDNKKYLSGHTKNFIKTYVSLDALRGDDYKDESYIKDKYVNKIYKVKLIKAQKEEMIGEILWED